VRSPFSIKHLPFYRRVLVIKSSPPRRACWSGVGGVGGRGGVCVVKGATKVYKSYPQILSYILAIN